MIIRIKWVFMVFIVLNPERDCLHRIFQWAFYLPEKKVVALFF